MWPVLELREIQTFLTLAEELHFGRTAERLGVTPSRVSQTIRIAETRVGGRLFERTSRRVRLTPLGTEFDDRLRPLYNEMNSALDMVSTSVKQSTGTLRVGVTITTDRPSVDRLLAQFRHGHPECEVSVEEIEIWEPYDPLRNGEIDVLCNWLAVEEPDLTLGPVIERCSRVLVIGSDHPLAQRPAVTSEEFAGERLNRPPKRYPQALADAILVPRTPSGRPIARTDEELESVPEVVAMIARGEIVSINVRDGSRFVRPDIVLVPITDLPPLPLGLIWCTAHENARIRALARVASSVEAHTPRQLKPPVPAGEADELS